MYIRELWECLMSKVFKLTPEVLERMINEEKRKLLVQGDHALEANQGRI